MNIYQKIVEIRKGIEGFSKDGDGYGYKYVTGNQVLRAIKGKMDELGVVLIPSVNYDTVEWQKHEYKNAKGVGKLDFIVQGQMTYKWVNAENPTDTIEVQWLMMGQQADDISKAVGTALTYNERYFLMKFFGLPTDEDDPDKKKEEDKKKPTPPNKTLPPQPIITDEDYKALMILARQKGVKPSDIIKESVNKFKKADLRTLAKKEYAYFIAILNKKKDLVKKPLVKPVEEIPEELNNF